MGMQPETVARPAELECDLDGLVLRVSPALEALLGRSLAAAIGEPISTLVAASADGAPELAALLVGVRKDGHAAGQLQLPVSNAVLSVDARRLDAQGPPRARVRFEHQRPSHQGAEGVRLRILADASRAFADAGLELDCALDAIVRFVADAIGDACIVRLLAADGVTLVAAAAHDRRPAGLAALREVIMKIPMRADEGVQARVMAGETVLLAHIDEAQQRQHTQAAAQAHVALMRVSSVVMAPLRARGRVLGYIGLNRDAGGPPYGHHDVTLLEDLAHRAAMAIQAATLYRDAQRAIAVRDDFIVVASHELRTPLSTLLLNLASAAKYVDEHGEDASVSAIAKRLRSAEAQARRLARLVEMLLEASQIEAGALRIDREPLELAAVVRDVIDRLALETTLAGCSVAFSSEGPTQGSWDRLHVEQIASNLVTNALKYGRGAPVEVRVVGRGALCELHVVDQGIGIDAEQRSTLFQRFARGTSARVHSGFGLGLWIASEMVRALGGTIALEASTDRGAHFVVRLPRE